MINSIMKGLIGIRNGFSRLMGVGYMQTDWEPVIPNDLQAFQRFINRTYKWKSDPWHGLLDHIQPVKHMNYQLEHYKRIKGDCDDLATYSCYLLNKMGHRVWRVNVYTHQHVICVMRTTNRRQYRYVNNNRMSHKVFDKLDDAVRAVFRDDGKHLDYILEDMSS